MQIPAKYVGGAGFFISSTGDTLRAEKIVLAVDGAVKGLEDHPAVAKLERKKDRVIVFLRKGKYLHEKDIQRYVRGKVKRIEIQERVRERKRIKEGVIDTEKKQLQLQKREQKRELKKEEAINAKEEKKLQLQKQEKEQIREQKQIRERKKEQKQLEEQKKNQKQLKEQKKKQLQKGKQEKEKELKEIQEQEKEQLKEQKRLRKGKGNAR